MNHISINVFVSILVKKKLNFNMMFWIYLLIWKELCFYVEIIESDMHEHGCSAGGKRNLCVILSLWLSLSSILTLNTTLLKP